MLQHNAINDSLAICTKLLMGTNHKAASNYGITLRTTNTGAEARLLEIGELVVLSGIPACMGTASEQVRQLTFFYI